MRSYTDIEQMAACDYSIGLTAHYKPFADLVKERGYKTVVEVGTAYAGNAFHILQNVQVDKLTCVDPYLFYPAMPGFVCQEEYDTLFQFATDRLAPWKQVSMLRMTSKEAISQVEPADVVFLDGSHDYEDVIWECENYSKIIKAGGVLSGHDYNIFEGVNKAVDEYSLRIEQDVKLLDGNIWYFNM